MIRILLLVLLPVIGFSQKYTFENSVYNAGVDDDVVLSRGYIMTCEGKEKENDKYWDFFEVHFDYQKHIENMIELMVKEKKTIDWLFENMPCEYNEESARSYNDCVENLSNQMKTQLKHFWHDVGIRRSRVRLFELNILLLDQCSG